MGRKLNAQEMTLYRRTDEVLHYLWDPIGVNEFPGARDEYYSYLPHVFALLQSNADAEDIAEYLTRLERDVIGLRSRPDRARQVAAILSDYRRWIKENSSHSKENDG